MGHVDLIRSPFGLAFCAQRRWHQRPPEEGQLVAKVLPIIGDQVAGIVPPLGLIVQMGAMIGGAYATHGEPMIPFYIFYSMFGFQRTADEIWAFQDARGRGFIGGTGGAGTEENHGVRVTGAGSKVTSTRGDISITGTGGAADAGDRPKAETESAAEDY